MNLPPDDNVNLLLTWSNVGWMVTTVGMHCRMTNTDCWIKSIAILFPCWMAG